MSNLYFFKNLSEFALLKHYVSTRKGGSSMSPYDTLNLSSQLKDDLKAVEKNRALVAEYLQVSKQLSFFPQQTHSANVTLVSETTTAFDIQNTDALITNTPNIAISVLAADCVPIILYDIQNHAIASIHAGWKGTVGEIVIKTLDKMKIAFGTLPAQIYAGIGPSISLANFKVGEEVAEKFESLYGKNSTVVQRNKVTGKAHVDLWEANKIQLINTGVPVSQIEISGLCTYANPALFFSARRDGFQTGRFAAGASLLKI